MSELPRPETPPLSGKDEEERLLKALIGRELLTSEEAKEFLADRPPGERGAHELLRQLVQFNYLTPHQAKRALANLETWLHQPIPGYEILEKLGRGSMGVVYKARQLSVNRLVAIKVLHSKLAANPGYIERFLKEAHVAAMLSHNNIVQAISAGSVGPLHYFVMEYVEGPTIKQEIDAGKVFEEREALEIGLQIAQALEHAHRRRLIHRDVKPANILRTPEGLVKLADLGLARRVQDEELAEEERGTTIGTPFYIAPELIGGQLEADIRADIYSLGATLYHMVTGRPPFVGKSTLEVLQKHLTEELIPPDHINTRLSTGFGEVIEMMMMKDRNLRYQEPSELIADLEALLRGEPPKLARKKLSYVALEQLAEGEVEKSQASVETTPRKVSVFWFIVVLTALILSVLLNLLLFTLL
ncbi:MAG: serine/threonine protein kinase [Gemmatales bacterium]|nr:serine/threonine protein kinase [Gemmatales bacterium]MDW8385731.1 serine/threonine-protein kinase [Gemmatales bacterium]